MAMASLPHQLPATMSCWPAHQHAVHSRAWVPHPEQNMLIKLMTSPKHPKVFSQHQYQSHISGNSGQGIWDWIYNLIPTESGACHIVGKIRKCSKHFSLSCWGDKLIPKFCRLVALMAPQPNSSSICMPTPPHTCSRAEGVCCKSGTIPEMGHYKHFVHGFPAKKFPSKWYMYYVLAMQEFPA